MVVLTWLRDHDAGLWATRRATRSAVIMPGLFAIGSEVLVNAQLATFAAFGSIALLLLVDFAGTRLERVQAMIWLSVLGAGSISLATLVSNTAWLGALLMAAVGFVVLFAGVVSSVLASASTSLLLAFVLPVATPGPVSSIPDRLAGWGLAAATAVLAVGLLWPAPPQDPLRGPAIECCRLLAERLRSRDAADRALAATRALRQAFYAGPNRPTGLGTSARTLVRLVDELGWLSATLGSGGEKRPVPDVAVRRVHDASADVMERCADLLAAPTEERAALTSAVDELRTRVHELQDGATERLPVHADELCRDGERIRVELVDGLEPTYRAQEIAFAVGAIADNVRVGTAAETRSWVQRLLGVQPDGAGSVLATARERAAAHLDRRSVWLHNSLRGAIGLGLAVLVADLTHAQHSFWIVLGALSVLRSNALSTGQTVARALLGTMAGIVIGGALVTVIGTDRTVLWILLPICLLAAGLAPAAISFTAGQAGFTLVLVILFNIISPVGYSVGILRIQNIAIGVAVSLVVGLLFWPRGASSALGRALADAYDASTIYLRSAVVYGIRCGASPDGAVPGHGSARHQPVPPTSEAGAAAAASRRLDDAFREYLAERGRKQVHLAEISSLVGGVVGPRLVGDAVLDLWRDDRSAPGEDRYDAGVEMTAAADRIVDWYQAFAAALTGTGSVPGPLARDVDTDERLIGAVRRDLAGADGMSTPTAVRMIWTGEHLDAVRRLQDTLVEPARALVRAHESSELSLR